MNKFYPPSKKAKERFNECSIMGNRLVLYKKSIKGGLSIVEYGKYEGSLSLEDKE